MKTSNPELERAGEFIRDTGCNIYLTGKAGTGKTTFLRTLQETTEKRMIITAPTGVAAINAKGVTLHSFFQLPFGPILPNIDNNRQKFKYSKDKINIIKSLDLLIIDEISMVRADLLDGVNKVLQRFRRNSLPFGGVQLLMIGDLFQLPPVVKDNEWRLLQEHYQSPYFFNSLALSQQDLITIELQHIYRQEDNNFIQLLNQVRSNTLTQESLKKLNSRAIPNFSHAAPDGYITLCTHNSKADSINAQKLTKLSEKVHNFTAIIDGDFPEHTFPTASSLKLKTGAQVMFIRNDNSPEKRYFNGKIGNIIKISNDNITIRCPDELEEIIVEPTTWDNIDYTLDNETQEITERKLGSFSQYPLRLAWAITIHKSQGLTFNKAIIDAQAAFAHGQVYVALSRCRTFDGLILSTPLVNSSLKCDINILNFTRKNTHNSPTTAQLEFEKVKYQQQLLLECFDFHTLRSLTRRLISFFISKADLLHISNLPDLADLQQKIEKEICSVGENFQNQLRGLFQKSVPASSDEIVLDRLHKASIYFQDKITTYMIEIFSQLTIESDNKEIRKKARNYLKYLLEEIQVKFAAVRSCENGFTPSHYFRQISAAAIEKKKIKRATKATINYAESDIQHPEFFLTLKNWRTATAKKEGVANFQVLHQKTLIQIAIHLPVSKASLLKIKGIGKRLIEKYGEELVGLARAFRTSNSIEQVELPPLSKPSTTETKSPKTKVSTKDISLQLHHDGLSPQEIAKERNLTLITIEKHLAHFVTLGQIKIDTFLTLERQKIIGSMLSELSDSPLKEIKQALGADFSYAEINFMRAHMEHIKTFSPT